MRNLPSIVSKLPNDLKQFLERVREALGKGEIVTKEELIQAGIVRLGRGGAIESVVGSPISRGGAIGSVDGSPIIPPAAFNVAATGAMTSIFVEFDYPEYRGHAYAEIWRAETNNLGLAQMVGQTPGKFYADAVGGATVRWYWVRLVSTTDTAGPYNGTEGTRGETSPDPAYLLEQLAGSITETQLYADLNSRINLIDGSSSLHGSVDYRIQNEATARATADSAIATQISTLQSTVGSNTTSIQTQATTIDGLSAQHTVKIDNNGYVTGYGLASTPVNGVPVSEFAVVADRFTIAPVATNPSAADGSPFFYLTAPTTINGVSIPAGAYMKSAYIHDASITNAKIANLSAEKITAGDISADRMSANAIQAVNLSAKYIHADRIDTPTLTAKLAAIQTAYIDEANIANGAISNAKIGEFIQSNNYAADSAGWRIDKTGFAEFQNVKVRGDVQATSLNAATGTFTGQLSAATGTFGGQLLAGVLDLALAAGSSYIYDQPGTYYFTVPQGMTSIRITCVGAGGGGGSGGSGDDDGGMGGSGAGGGGAGQANQGVYNNITPGTVLTIVVGQGGAGGVGFYGLEAAGLPGSAGTTSYVAGYLGSLGGAGGGAGPGGDDDYLPPSGGAGGYLGGQTGTVGGAKKVIETSWNGEQRSVYKPHAGSGGAGGSSGYGTNGAGGVGGNTATQPGANGVRGSGGGGGAGGLPSRPGGSGGAGGNGLVIVEAYNPNAVVLQTTFKTFTNNHFNALCSAVGRGDLIFAG